MAGPYRGALVRMVVRAQVRFDRASQAAAAVKGALLQISRAVDAREVAGGFVGLTAGEAIGGAVGGVAGAAVAGPAGAIVGAEVGAFTAGMLGLKLGMDAVQDFREASAAPMAPGGTIQQARRPVPRLFRRKMQGRAGEIAGLTIGATAGLVIAGPTGGLVGTAVGETVGGQIKQGFVRSRTLPTVFRRPDGRIAVTRWLNRFGRQTTGEATTILVVGSVGSLFGMTGLKVGQRIGRVVGQRIEWDKLGEQVDERQV